MVTDAAKKSADDGEGQDDEGRLRHLQGPAEGQQGQRPSSPPARRCKQTDVELEKMNYLVEGVIGSGLDASQASMRRRRSGALGRALRGRRRSRCPIGALAAALLLFGVLRLARRREPGRGLDDPVQGRVRRLVLVAEHAAARRAADADGAVRRAAGARRPDHHRRRGRASCSAGSPRRRCRTRSPLPATSSAPRWLCVARHGRRRGLDRARRRAAPVPRRQRDDLEPAARLHRDRALQAPGRRAAARPGKTSTSRRRASLGEALQIGGIAGSDVHWGLVLGVVACVGLGLLARASRRAASRCASSAATRAPRSSSACRRTG